MIVSWPGRITRTACAASTRHVADIVPTIYSMLGIKMPDAVKG